MNGATVATENGRARARLLGRQAEAPRSRALESPADEG